jgi:VIT1/CCC1 family predicted Fe2+/Mn2+ transporter
MFGLIMALTFTCAISVTSSNRADVMTMLAGALGCNVAWGLVDAAMYLLSQIVSREQRRSLTLDITSASPHEARRLLLDNLPDGVDKVFSPPDLDRLAEAIRAMPRVPRRAAPTPDDLRGAVHIFLLVFLSTLPVALPFVFMTNVGIALRTSNAIAVLLLFVVGTGLGRHMKWKPYWVTGLCVAIFGALLVSITIALGG